MNRNKSYRPLDGLFVCLYNYYIKDAISDSNKHRNEIMFTTILYVSLCFSNTDCVSYEPQVWTANSVAELNKDLEACAKEERRYMKDVIGTYRESDCLTVEKN